MALHAAKPDVLRTVLRRSRSARENGVAYEKVFGTEPGAAADDALAAFGGAGRIFAGALGVVVLREPVGAPLPHVARHVVETKTVGRE